MMKGATRRIIIFTIIMMLNGPHEVLNKALVLEESLFNEVEFLLPNVHMQVKDHFLCKAVDVLEIMVEGSDSSSPLAARGDGFFCCHGSQC